MRDIRFQNRFSEVIFGMEIPSVDIDSKLDFRGGVNMCGGFCSRSTKDPGFELTVDPLTGKMYMRTKDGEVVEVVRDEATGKLYIRTKSGRLKELGDHLEVRMEQEGSKDLCFRNILCKKKDFSSTY